MPAYQFEAPLERPELRGAWTFIRAPFSVEKEFGVKGRVAVQGAINGIPFRSSLLPQGGGEHILVVNKELRDRAGVTAGDTARFVLERDDAPREVDLPAELAQALAANTDAQSLFARLSYSHQKEYADYVAEAKRPETRQRRAANAVDLLLAAEAKGLTPRYRHSRS